MPRKCQTPTALSGNLLSDKALEKIIYDVYAELSINFQYVDVAGLKLTGMTLEGY